MEPLISRKQIKFGRSPAQCIYLYYIISYIYIYIIILRYIISVYKILYIYTIMILSLVNKSWPPATWCDVHLPYPLVDHSFWHPFQDSVLYFGPVPNHPWGKNISNMFVYLHTICNELRAITLDGSQRSPRPSTITHGLTKMPCRREWSSTDRRNMFFWGQVWGCIARTSPNPDFFPYGEPDLPSQTTSFLAGLSL